jgi:hypothetical protein
MIRRTGFILLEIVGIAIGGTLAVAAIAIWRLSAAPVEARFIGPYIEQAVNGAGLGFAVRVAEAKIDWRGFTPRLALNFHGVSVSGESNAAIGTFEDGTLTISVRNLVFGRPSVVEIDVRRPEVHIIHTDDDRFVVRFGGGGNGGGDFGEVINRMMAPPDYSGPLGQLRRLRIVDGRVIIEDRKLGVSWSAPDVQVDLGRSASEATGRIDMNLALPGRVAHLQGQARHADGDGRTDISIEITNFDAAAAAPLVKALAPLSVLAVPVGGKLQVVLDRNGKLVSGEAKLHGDKGNLIFPDFYAEPVSFNSIGLDLRLADGLDHIVLDKLAIDLGGPTLTAIGAFTTTGNRLAIEGRVDLTEVPLNRFDGLWPHGFAVGGRDWVITHIPNGIIKTGSVRISASGLADHLDSIEIDDVKGALNYTGLEVHYFPPLRPVRDIAGHGTFDQRGMDLTIDSGSLGDISVTGGVIALTGFDRDDRGIDIALTMKGPLSTALGVLDTPPLGYARELGVKSEAVDGQIDVRAKFKFPLVKTLMFKQIALGAEGTLDDVSIAGIVGPRDLSQGALTIALDKKGMNVKGTARLAKVPLNIDWRESFDPAEATRSRIAFASSLTDDDRSSLGLNLPSVVRLSGKTPVTGTVTINRAGRTSVDASVDLLNAGLAIDRLGFDKPAAQAGRATIATEFVGGELRRISDLRVESARSSIAGTADFDEQGGFQHAELSHLRTPRNDFTATIDRQKDEGPAFAVSVKGRRLDAAPLFASSGSDGSLDSSPRLDITAAIGHVLIGKDSGFDDLEGSASLIGGRLVRAHARALAQKPVTFDFTPKSDVTALHLVAEDAGATLAALDLTRGMSGGVLRLDGETRIQAGSRLTSATLDIRDFRLLNAPITAQLLNAISPTGFVDELSGKGLAFDQLKARMDYGDGRLTFHDGRSAGTLGISFEGAVDLDKNVVALKGTVVPVDTLNSIFRAIPVLGEALTGGGRGGLFGWTYSVTGSPEDPKVSVNPLSMFAPGFLRNLFFLGPSQPARGADAAPAGEPGHPGGQ